MGDVVMFLLVGAGFLAALIVLGIALRIILFLAVVTWMVGQWVWRRLRGEVVAPIDKPRQGW
jgi:Na+-transporting methylmalonyl-CoA/oxaloacetate decarboxylase gamma subunit